jgi:hypothetical protein
MGMVCRDTLDLLGLGASVQCTYACSTPADCTFGNQGAWDADHFECVAGGCLYLGCNSDEECQWGGDLVCRYTDLGINLCLNACSTSADCDFGTAAYDADNFACVDGACVYVGCNSTDECASVDASYVCVEP